MTAQVWVRYKGTNRDGVAKTGVTYRSGLPGFVLDRWRWGWQSLLVEHDGERIAAVEQIDGRRVWWAES